MRPATAGAVHRRLSVDRFRQPQPAVGFVDAPRCALLVVGRYPAGAVRLATGPEPLLTLLPTETNIDGLEIQVPQSQQGEYLVLVLKAEVDPSFQDGLKDLLFRLDVR